jgi:hypothetical protein
MANKENDKQFQFVKLCASLTKQGLNFTRQKGVRYGLTFDKISSKRVFHPNTKTPFVNSISRIAGDSKKDCYIFNQWADQ